MRLGDRVFNVIVAVVRFFERRGSDAGELDSPPEAREIPNRFTIIPDDYHAEFAGTARDGRQFFVTQLFEMDNEFVATFLWRPDGSFDSIEVEEFGARGSFDAETLESARAGHLAALSPYRLEPITVAPFSVAYHGTTFGFVARAPEKDDEEAIAIVELLPGNFMAYYWPWDGEGYDT